jgi:4'-phosphopantetheinyl transferase
MPVFLKKNISDAALLGVWEITESPEMLKQQIHLNEEEENLYNSFGNDTRRIHWLSYRVLLKELISEEEYSHIIYDKNGKPFLSFNSHHLSVSHSGKYSAVIVSKENQVGIDIEKIQPKIEKVISKFLTEKEIAQLGSGNLIEKFCTCWCAKEALYKLYGKRQLLFNENIRLLPFIFSERGSLSGEIVTKKFHKKYLLQFEKIDDYMLVYADGL